MREPDPGLRRCVVCGSPFSVACFSRFVPEVYASKRLVCPRCALRVACGGVWGRPRRWRVLEDA